MMHFHVLTLFPDMIMQGLSESIIGRATQNGYIDIEAVNIRDYTLNKHKRVDDYTYGGGAGMLMQAQPVYDTYLAVEERILERRKASAEVSANTEQKQTRVIYVTPQGEVFSQKKAMELSEEEDLIFLCGHYEGIDERVLEEIVTDYISIGDYVLTGGELPAMVMIDTISRLVPGVLNNDDSALTEPHSDGLLEYPHYTKPREYDGLNVPDVLLSGNHQKIKEWRRVKQFEITKVKRPDLFEKFLKSELSKTDLKLLKDNGYI